MKTILLILVLSTITLAQDTWPKFLGPEDPSVVAFTPKHRIRVFTGGFDLPRRKQVERKLPNKMDNNGVPLDKIIAAQDYARRLTGQESPSTMLGDIDDAADSIIRTYEGCGGSYASFIHRLDWSSVTIRVRDTVIADSHGGLNYGLTYDKHNASVVCLSFWYWFSNPPASGLVTINAICQWELGNVAWKNYSDKFRDIGTGRPCE